MRMSVSTTSTYSRGDQVARRNAVLGDQHLEAVALEQQPHPLAHRLLVVGDQNARLVEPVLAEHRAIREPDPDACLFMTPAARRRRQRARGT